MAYIDMTTGQMVEQGQRLVRQQADGGMRHMFADLVMAPYASMLDAVLAEMTGQQVRISALEPVIKQLTIEMGDEDALADGLLSATRNIADNARVLMSDPAPLDAAIAAIFGPQTLFGLVNAPYDGIGGEATLVEQRMAPAHWAALERINLDGFTLKDAVAEWLRLARSISTKDSKRAELGLQLDDAVSRQQAREVRLRWINVIRGIESAAALSSLSERDQELMLKPLQDAAAQAGKKVTPAAP
jgi:hypothetical protein